MSTMTIERLEKMTDLEIIDFVTAHMLKQNEKSGDDAHCLYRDPKGRECAVGCLIPDDLYKEEFEAHLVATIVDEGLAAPALTTVLTKHISLLRELQHVHDRIMVAEWPQKLEALRHEFTGE